MSISNDIAIIFISDENLLLDERMILANVDDVHYSATLRSVHFLSLIIRGLILQKVILFLPKMIIKNIVLLKNMIYNID